MFAPKVATICQDNPQMCNDLNSDEWCRGEKAEIIKQRYRHPDDGEGEDIYRLMLMFEDYQRCITNASGLTHKKYRDKEADRMKGVLTARKELDRLNRKTRNSSEPLLAWYHWSRSGDEDALKRFMAAASAGRLNTPEQLIALASIQAQDDMNRTRDTLYRALSLYKDDENVDVSVFHTLTTISMEQKKYKLAWIWSKVASHYSDSINTHQLEAMATKFQLPASLMNNVADEITGALEDGEFDAKALGLTKL
ncbi:DUF2989 domain-containing protein [Alteromonas sp. RKMC-009]|uniref:DUF2989 domain-containing protein n=1 Tax=Alteromonas sp. RKMC-009 TaxID=2267264 RepID=UPI0010C2666D|nr:DUF2989 domain-containing protein [Alteromonas sp. RKMC-009]AYA64230.2 DUF2989 domain-containing protein [Alteromonas sp. RKMC-009]